ncbi:MAG: FMN-binding protein [Flavobacteriaceae bacterium]|nr:FMN-binding protein [Flavobacteriaceae bacterium]
MIFKRLLIIIFLLLSTQVDAFQLKKSIQKKVNKEVAKTFDTKNFALKSITVSSDLNTKLYHKTHKSNLSKIVQENQIIGYVFIAKAPSKTDQFDYLIILDKDLIIKKVKVLVYREDYGGEIGSRRWLKQFIGKTSGENLKYTKDIIAISGATISAQSMTVAVNTFLKDLVVFKANNIL